MFVSKLEITNFRGIANGTVSLQPFTTLIGPNNCGKTTIVEALALVLGRDRLIRQLTEHDFYGSSPARQDRILIVATLAGFANNDPERNPSWFRHGRAAIKWQEKATGDIKAVANLADDQLACQIAFAARFDLDSLEAVTIRYFYDADDGADPFAEDSAVVTVPSELIRELGFFLVPANRTWDRMISFGSELFRRVVSYVSGRPAAAVLAERERLRDPDLPLDEDVNLAELVANVNSDIRKLFGKSIDLKLRLTTTDSEGILDAIAPHYSTGAALPIPARKHGSGLVSLQTLILLSRFGYMRVERGEGFMMVIEEPELHVPPPLQRKLLHHIRAMTTQTIVTTHSPTVAGVTDAHEISVVINTSGSLRTRALLKQKLQANADNCVRNLFLTGRDATVSALMHETTLIPEGKRDAVWLQFLVKALERTGEPNFDEALRFGHEVGVIITPDARTTDTLRLLHDVPPSVICLFDGDNAGNDYVAAASALATPPKAIIQWPVGWEIEHAIDWIVAADATALDHQNIRDAQLPVDRVEFLAALRGARKSDEIAHAIIADTLIRNAPCRIRIAHILRLIADIGAGRDPLQNAAVASRRGNTTLWTFNNAFPGI